ncbi:OmpA family protein [uncultured Photobacterium sp.]|uniref:OmpA family protein n=1 Tax=uncultured Photobacterium sp. TaxID=173973 RepID=UPI00260A71FE|nr:OmpA family protein [uncultured Photobacterium sp.]
MINRNILVLALLSVVPGAVSATCIDIANTYVRSVEVTSTTHVTTQKKGELLNIVQQQQSKDPVRTEVIASEKTDSESCLFDNQTKSLVLIYDFNKQKLTESHKEILKQYLTVIDDDTSIVIEGHADATGAKKYNLKLSNRRADNVASYLRDTLAQGTRIVTKGFGESKPVCSVRENRADGCNRRVVLTLSPNQF